MNAELVSVRHAWMWVGLGLDPKTFVDKATYGPHLLAPTATDLNLFGQQGAIFAGFHTVAFPFPASAPLSFKYRLALTHEHTSIFDRTSTF